MNSPTLCYILGLWVKGEKQGFTKNYVLEINFN